MSSEPWTLQAAEALLKDVQRERDRLHEALERIATDTTLVTTADGEHEAPVYDFRARARAIEALKMGKR